jgi:hypothetical protein
MELPLNPANAIRFSNWIKTNYGDQITQSLNGTPFNIVHACAIACQETGVYALGFTQKLSKEDVLARCVFDASGDISTAPRSAFPVNTAAFRARYGDAFTQMLIAEANKMRALRGFSPANYVYKGYGIFQYDLQHVTKDEEFFKNRLWYDFDQCMDRLKLELMRKYATQGEVWESIRAYNGTGKRAQAYKENVKTFYDIISQASFEQAAVQQIHANTATKLRDAAASELATWQANNWTECIRIGNTDQAASDPNTQAGSLRVAKYWLEGLGDASRNGCSVKSPWSAAFICWCMRNAGVPLSDFPYSSAHHTYIRWAINNAKSDKPDKLFYAQRPYEYKPKVGDLVAGWREEKETDPDPDISFDKQPDSFYASHCDIVVDVSDTVIKTIGGNVSDKVGLKNMPAQNGILLPNKQLICVMRISS